MDASKEMLKKTKVSDLKLQYTQSKKFEKI